MSDVVLTIAGSDPSGGAGIQADLKVFAEAGLFGISVPTLITVQDSKQVYSFQGLEAGIIVSQIERIVADMPPKAAKLGAISGAKAILEFSRIARKFKFPLVVDPIVASSSGAVFVDREGIEVYKKEILPLAFLLTPNAVEAEVFSGIKVEDQGSATEAAQVMKNLGAKNVLIKGGHTEEENSVDYLFFGDSCTEYSRPRLKTKLHGSGCLLSSSITARLALRDELPDAVGFAKNYLHQILEKSER